MKNLFSTALILTFFFLTQNLNAEVYSRINFQSLIKGCSDCWLVNYTLWENHGTIKPGDDTLKGTYNAIVGTDCPHLSLPGVPLEIPQEAKPDTNSQNQKTFHLEQFEIAKPINKKPDHNRFRKKIKIKEIKND